MTRKLIIFSNCEILSVAVFGCETDVRVSSELPSKYDMIKTCKSCDCLPFFVIRSLDQGVYPTTTVDVESGLSISSVDDSIMVNVLLGGYNFIDIYNFVTSNGQLKESYGGYLAFVYDKNSVDDDEVLGQVTRVLVAPGTELSQIHDKAVELAEKFSFLLNSKVYFVVHNDMTFMVNINDEQVQNVGGIIKSGSMLNIKSKGWSEVMYRLEMEGDPVSRIWYYIQLRFHEDD